MKIGAMFPQTEIGSDPAVIRDFAQAADALGFEYLEVWDHVILPDSTRPGREPARYGAQTIFHEPLVLLGYVAAITNRLELVTGVLILPQRQTVLVAKQAAEVDVLSNGRLRLGVGLGWVALEYEALGVDFHRRGRLIEEQITVMRRLWAEQVVDFHGRNHVIDGAGMSPLPPGRSIPIWMGGRADAALRRAARLADGWMPAYFGFEPDDEIRQIVGRLHGYLREWGRDPGDFGIEGRTPLIGDPDGWRRHTQAWCDFGASHMTVNTMGAGLAGPGDHIEGLRRFAREVGLQEYSSR